MTLQVDKEIVDLPSRLIFDDEVLRGLPMIATVASPRNAPSKRLFGTDRRIWNSKVNARTQDTNIDRFGLPE